MKAVVFTLVLMSGFCAVTCGQTSKADLEHLYGLSRGNMFSAGPGLSVTAYYRSADRVCGLVISGAETQREVMRVFDAVSPARSRGVKKMDLEECAGGCQQVLEYANVSLVSGVFDDYQASTPSAIITFTRPGCKRIGEAVNRTMMYLRSTNR